MMLPFLSDFTMIYISNLDKILPVLKTILNDNISKELFVSDVSE